MVSYPQQTMLNKFKQSWPKMAFVCVLGIVVSYVIGRGREQTAFVWIINAIFSDGMASADKYAHVYKPFLRRKAS